MECLKGQLTQPTILVPPKDDELLLLYVATTTQVASATLVVERTEEGRAQKTQHLVYYISKVLINSKMRYPQIQKLIYGVLITKQKLCCYLNSFSVVVVTGYPLGEVINNREATGRISKSALELIGQGVSFLPRTMIKSQALADFIAEWSESQFPPTTVNLEFWTLHFDGSQNRVGSGAGVVFVSPQGVQMQYMVRLCFPASNNMAKYEAFLLGLWIAVELGIYMLEARGDSQFVVGQVTGEC